MHFRKESQLRILLNKLISSSKIDFLVQIKEDIDFKHKLKFKKKHLPGEPYVLASLSCK